MKHLFSVACSETQKIHQNIEDRVDFREFRMNALGTVTSGSLTKVAFDTRKINQYSDYNPRRNLQYYHRSEPFITKDTSEQIKTLFKLKMAVDSIKDDFSGDPDWFDSYCRILHAALDRTLRLEQNDMDFFKPQLDYLQELLYLRYRLKDNDIISLNEKQIRDIILDKDEKLMHKQIYSNYNNGGLLKANPEMDNRKSDIKVESNVEAPNTHDLLMNKLFGDVKASKDNKNIERSVTITINDKIIDDMKKEG